MSAPAEAKPRRNGWTGGQYGLLRALLGLAVAARLAGELAAPSARAGAAALPDVFELARGAGLGGALAVLGLALCALLVLGRFDRTAAVLLAALEASRAGLASPELAWLPALLLAHALTPPAPFLSLAARGRVDPRGGWSLDARVVAVPWALLAASYALDGLASLSLPDASALAPLGLAFAPLALVPRLRPWIWCFAVGQLAARILSTRLGGPPLDAEAASSLALLHVFAFDPGWVPARRGARPETVFFDGDCGLCHGFVRFVLAEDTAAAFRFAPLQDPAFERAVPAEQRAALPDSIVVLTEDGRLLVRSRAVLHVCRGLGGAWRALAELLALVPRPVRDAVYDGVARVRRRLFAKPSGACPLVPPDLARRFATGDDPRG